jgi:crotonobetainyl-CoA:carnitine CoA-transferase CaiB-like acyl-CoA transferase
MITNPLQKKAFDAVAAALPFELDAAKITVEPGVSYVQSPIRAHDYATGVMAAAASVVERLGCMRGLPSQTMSLNRRLSGLRLNDLQLQFLNGYSTLMDNWGIGPDNGTYRTKDGRYVTMIGLHPHLRDGLLDFFQCPNSTAGIRSAVEKKTAQQLEDEAARLNLPLFVMRTREEWLDHPQGKATETRAMIDIEQKGSERKRVLAKAKHRPLEGVRVLELTDVVSGPQAGQLLAEQGADVIKVQPPLGNVVYPIWMAMSWGKRNILLDVKSTHGKKRFAELLGSADVLIDSMAPGAIERLGFDESTRRRLNPNLVYAKLSFAAPETPWGNRRGFEQTSQAVTGVMDTHSKELAEPTLVAALITDALTGYLLATGVGAALSEREEKGGYWHVGAYLTRCAAEAVPFAEPGDAEEVAPVTIQDFIDFGVDQDSPFGTFTRFAPSVQFSHTPAMAMLATSWPGTSPDTVEWMPVADAPPKMPAYPSKLAREDGIRNLTVCYGIPDRGDAPQGGFGLASKDLPDDLKAQVQKYMAAQKRKAGAHPAAAAAQK